MARTLAPRRAVVVALFSLLTLVGFLVGCATNPVTGRREISLVSEGQELALGKEGHAAVLQEYGVYDNPELQAYVNGIGQSLAKVSHRPGLAWTFTVIDDPAVNAFALPGGYIYITRGILADLNSEAQLAGVLGHEIGHVTARHSAQQITQQQLFGLGLVVGSIFSQTLARHSQEAQQALGLLFLKYSRDDENQADDLGVRYSVLDSYDAREMPATYRTLKRVGDASGQRLPTFLSTHPDPGDREVRVAALAREQVAGKTGLIIKGRDFVQRTDGLVYGRDPRNGYFEGSHYYHPSLRFQMDLPGSWKYIDTNSALGAVEPNQKAQLVVSMVKSQIDSPTDAVNQLVQSGQVSGAEGRSETINGYPAWVGRVRVTSQQSGASQVLLLALVRREAGQMFQFVGQNATPGDDNDTRMLQAIRSLRPLTDASRLNPQAARLRVVKVTQSMSLADFLKTQGTLGATPEEIAIANDLDLGETVAAGTLVKIVTPAKLRS
jgi:predicted Zn-dependent protease